MPTDSLPESRQSISCVICAFNEAPRIAAVLEVVSRHPILHEVIVVDDGSTDGTAEVVKQFPSVKLISSQVNQGKSAAMAAGIAAARCEILMLLDADLKGLRGDHITALAEPVLDGSADVGISLRKNSLYIFRLIGLDFVSGERVIRKDILTEALPQMLLLPRFGVEVFMNKRIVERRLSIAVARWIEVTQSRKTEKLGYWRGIAAEWRMIADLLHVHYPVALISQTVDLLSLRVKAAPLSIRENLKST
ncbi:glycosyltransferase [Herbaspirillum sp. RV1423]|uniref:glycosyltransferase family 2 protein n=1 Tax=Herbaspirillum sp. RV1423 TaxID=1443993 RepID=UPI0009DD3BC4|nr:glycosyltransferase [Herbaspirillum sp. RV1423]